MAGRYQHHLWQHIQRGFGTKRGGDHHIWIHATDGTAKQTVTRKFGRENFFYGSESDSEADENITIFESDLAPFITKSREQESGTKIDTEAAKSLVCHLEMRSAFLRAELSRLTEMTISQLQNKFSEREFFRKIMKQFIVNRPNFIGDELEKLGIDKAVSSAAAHLIVGQLEDLSADIELEMTPQMRDVFEIFLNMTPILVKDSHNKALKADFTSAGRRSNYVGLEFMVQRYSDELILPDNYVCFATSRKLTPITQGDDRLDEIFLPISSSAVIYGFRSNPVFRDSAQINRMTASTSFQNFISRSTGSEFVRLTKKIGKNAKLLSEKDVNAILREHNFEDI